MSLDMNIKPKEQFKIQVMSSLRSFMSPGFHVLVLYVHKEIKLKVVFKQLEKGNLTALNEQIFLIFFMPSASLQNQYQSWLLHILIIYISYAKTGPVLILCLLYRIPVVYASCTIQNKYTYLYP